MEEKKLTREEIALQILNGVISSPWRAAQGSGGGALEEYCEGSKAHEKRDMACSLAFELADLFIKKRDNMV